jgi:WD40 repeat protein
VKISKRTPLGRLDEGIMTVDFSLNGGLLLAAGISSERGRIWSWVNETWDPANAAEIGQENLSNLACSADGSKLAASTLTTTRLHVLNLPGLDGMTEVVFLKPPWKRSVAGHLLTSTIVNRLSFDPSGRFLALADTGECSRILDLETDECVELNHPKAPVDFVKWAEDGRQLISGSYLRLITTDVRSGQVVDRLDLDAGEAWKHVTSPNSPDVFSVSSSGRIVSRDPKDGSIRRAELRLKPRLLTLAYSAAHRLLAILRKDGLCLFWDVERWEPAGKARISSGEPNAIAFHPQLLYLAVATGGLDNAPLVVIELER